MQGTASQSLTDGQIACLGLVAENLTSKEIALRLGISPHTVDQRLRKALRTLDVPTRRQAVRLVMARQGQGFPPARPQPAREPNRPPPKAEAAAARQTGTFGTLPLPFATAARPRNTMLAWQRLGWIVAIALGSAFAVTVYLAGLESLARLLQS